MAITLTHTNSAKISSALLRARRSAGSPAMGMVLTLIIVCDEAEYEDALHASMQAGREHPSRILLVVTGTGRQSTLDAEVRIGEGTPGEVVIIRMRGAVSGHPASVIRPLLLPDSPVVIWWPGKAPTKTADDELAQLALRRLTDSAAGSRPMVTLKGRAANYTPGDSDLSWTRLTPWRALLAAALDQYPARITAALVEAERTNPSADLLVAWLESRLKVPIERAVSDGPGITAVRMTTAAGDIAITRPDGLLARYAVPGQPERLVALKRREITDLISEELRRMDPDDVFASTLRALASGESTGGPTTTTAAKKTPAKKTAAAKKAPAQRPAAKKTTGAPAVKPSVKKAIRRARGDDQS